MSRTPDQLIDDYIKQLRSELADVPRGRRRELLGEISSHIAEARARLEHEREVDIRALLDRIGDPADIAAEARDRREPARSGSSAMLQAVRVVLLLVVFFLLLSVGIAVATGATGPIEKSVLLVVGILLLVASRSIWRLGGAPPY